MLLRIVFYFLHLYVCCVMKDLGVIFDLGLNFKVYIDTISEQKYAIYRTLPVLKSGTVLADCIKC